MSDRNEIENIARARAIFEEDLSRAVRELGALIETARNQIADQASRLAEALKKAEEETDLSVRLYKVARAFGNTLEGHPGVILEEITYRADRIRDALKKPSELPPPNLGIVLAPYLSRD